MDSVPLKIIQISDTHVYSDAERELLGVKTQEGFQAVLDLIRAEEADNIDLILHTGDLSQDGTEAAYTRIAECLQSFNVPVYCIPGNHDNAKMMAQVYPLATISNNRHIILKNWHIILLDSQIPTAVAGYLDPSQLNFLQSCLQAYPEHQALIAFHHHPLPVGCYWLDKIGLTNADEFWNIISHYPKINTVLFGHVHQVYENLFHHIKCYSAPSTCFQFMRKQDHFGIENLPPGYRWIHLYEDGRVETGIKRVPKYIGTFDSHAKGY